MTPYNDLLKSVAGPAVIHNGTNGKILASNQSFADLIDVPLANIEGMIELDFLDPQEHAAILRRMKSIHSTGMQSAVMETIITRTHERKRVVVNAREIDPQTGATLVEFWPIPQALVESTHDGGNVLQMLMMYLEQNPHPDPNKAAVFSFLSDQLFQILCNRLGRVDDPSGYQLVSIREVLEEALVLVTPLTKTYKISLTTVGDIFAEVDCIAIRRVITNLLFNGHKHGLQPGGVINITARIVAREALTSCPVPPADQRSRYVQICVADSGQGMSDDVLGNVRERLAGFCAASTTGVGIPYVGRVIREHSGWSEVVSKPGRGTCFSLYLPLPGDITV